MLPFHGFQHGLLKQVPPLRRTVWGWRGVRVGEASNPGPVQTRSTHRLAEPLQDTTQERVRVDVATTRRLRRRLRALPWSWDSDSDLDGPVTQVGRSERSCPVTQVDASSDEEVLVSSNHGRRVVPRTDRATVPANPVVFSAGLLPEHEFPTSGTASGSSQALARVQPISGAAESGNDEDQLRIGQHRNVSARVGDSHDRVEPQELPTVSASRVRGNFASGPAVDVQIQRVEGRRRGFCGEASNPGNRNLIFRRPRRARSAVLESDRMVEQWSIPRSLRHIV